MHVFVNKTLHDTPSPPFDTTLTKNRSIKPREATKHVLIVVVVLLDVIHATFHATTFYNTKQHYFCLILQHQLVLSIYVLLLFISAC